MQAIRESLAVSAAAIRAELALYDVLADALQTRYADDAEVLREFDRRARRSTYANTIVGCYGLIEQTVDAVLISNAETFERIYDRYGDIPDSIRLQHRELLLLCFKDGDRARIRGKVSERTALEALGREMDGPGALVPPAFTYSTANYRMPYTQMLFHRLGVEIGRGLSAGEPTDALDKTGFANYESFLEDLVQRRNDLAHSYGDDGILEPALLCAYVEVALALLNDIDRIAHLATVRRIGEMKLQPIGRVVKTWTGRVGIALDGGTLAVGDQLLLIKPDWCTSHQVESLQVSDSSTHEVTYVDQPINVAAAIASAPANAENALAYVIGPEWRDLWPPDSSGEDRIPPPPQNSTAE